MSENPAIDHYAIAMALYQYRVEHPSWQERTDLRSYVQTKIDHVAKSLGVPREVVEQVELQMSTPVTKF